MFPFFEDLWQIWMYVYLSLYYFIVIKKICIKFQHYLCNIFHKITKYAFHLYMYLCMVTYLSH